MRIAITGGTGFVGGHLARDLAARGHEVVLIARGADRRDAAVRSLPGARFEPIGTSDEDLLARAMSGCEAVAHLAGINRERGEQTFRRVHVEGTRRVVAAARRAGAARLALLSFLRARPGSGSPYHESKWAAEEIVRSSGLEVTVIKAGVIYGPGDNMLDHMSLAFRMFPAFALVGLRERPIRPLAVEDLVPILRAALTGDVLAGKTVAAVGPEEITVREAARRVAGVLRRRPIFIRLPVFLHAAIARVLEAVMEAPIASRAQVRMLGEGLAEPWGAVDELPPELAPRTRFTDESIRRGLPERETARLARLRDGSSRPPAGRSP
jgi:NADH dehydrogenase